MSWECHFSVITSSCNSMKRLSHATPLSWCYHTGANLVNYNYHQLEDELHHMYPLNQLLRCRQLRRLNSVSVTDASVRHGVLFIVLCI